jgi:hypothetical protein
MELADSATVLKHLESQYRVYRAEIRSYNQIAGASGSLLLLLLFGELAAANTNPTMWMLIPLSVISYSALLANIATFGHMAGYYTALLERKINELTRVANLFQYESAYVGARSDIKGESRRFHVFTVFIGLTPAVLSVYALVRLSQMGGLQNNVLGFRSSYTC